ncbi:protein TMEPAI-like [Cottoperca gobio]|uniref:Protein TMEPAI-like n=1 Tax=Cottoperca gobio TaxID=56716 RepID=A0A6J2PLX0_COTGO|nr:protein TMEPAI-like [Cottoperca gobio]
MQPSSGSHNHVNCVQTQLCAQLEFVQILVIVVVMMVMVVVITCLLNHYRLSARSLLSRHAPARRRHLPLANEASLWSSEGTGTNSLNEHQVYNPRPPDRGVPSSYLQREPQHASLLCSRSASSTRMPRNKNKLSQRTKEVELQQL